MMQPRSVRYALLGATASLLLAGVAAADITSDQAAALLLYPRVIALPNQETVIQLTNTSAEPQAAHCFYIDGGSRCSLDERLCDAIEDPCAPEEGLCLPRWIETDFDIFVTPRQPLAWRVTQGLSGDDLPLTGAIVGPGNTSNVGTSIPPLPIPFTGELKCIVVDGTGAAVPSNVLIGNATLVGSALPPADTVGAFQIDSDANKDNAIGIKAIDGDANGDNILVLGGGENEYNGCPQVLIVNFLFDFAITPVTGPSVSRLTLVPCTEDLVLQIPGSTTAQYLVFNEFEQRFSTSAPVTCYFDRQISRIDTRDPTRSIFSSFVSGTVAGQARVRGVQQGLLGVITMEADGSTAATNLHFQGERELADRWILPQ